MKPLSLTDSSVLKGIAILLMLCHHVFEPGRVYDDFQLHDGGMHLIGTFAAMCKVCVAIFVFVSGYGLMTKYGKEGHLHLKSFYWKRFVKLLMNYWFVWLIFVPLSVFLLSDKPFGWSYANTFVGLKSVLDFLGVLDLFTGSLPYNPTWWFYGCIIGLYLLFPLLHKLSKWGAVPLMALGVASYFCYTGTHFYSVKLYVADFVCGMLYATMVSSPGKSAPPRTPLLRRIVCLMLLALIFIERLWTAEPLLFDALIVTFGVYTYQQFREIKFLKRVFAFLGKYSMDMFLTHTFLFGLWPATHDIVYATKNPLVIYLTLLAMSLALAMLLGWVKNVTGYNRLINKLRNKI